MRNIISKGCFFEKKAFVHRLILDVVDFGDNVKNNFELFGGV